jgi:hypothetical protein
LAFELPDSYGPEINSVSDQFQYERFRYDYSKVLRRKLLDVLSEIEDYIRVGGFIDINSSASFLEFFSIDELPLIRQ